MRVLVVDFARSMGVGERVGDQQAQPSRCRASRRRASDRCGRRRARGGPQPARRGHDRLGPRDRPPKQCDRKQGDAATLRRVGIGNISRTRARSYRAADPPFQRLHRHRQRSLRCQFPAAVFSTLFAGLAAAAGIPTLWSIFMPNYTGPGVRSFRRRAFLRSGRIAAEELWRPAALAARRRPRAMAGLGAVAVCRYAARAGDERRALLVRRPRLLADPDRGAEHPCRSGVVAARLAVLVRGPEARQRSRHRLREAAADRCGAGLARSLRSSRRGNAVAAACGVCAARGHAARQRPDDEGA